MSLWIWFNLQWQKNFWYVDYINFCETIAYFPWINLSLNGMWMKSWEKELQTFKYQITNCFYFIYLFFFSRSFIAICFCNQIHKLKMKMPSPFKSQKMKNHNNVKTKTNWNKFLKNLLWAYTSNLFFLSCHHTINNASATYMKNSKWN